MLKITFVSRFQALFSPYFIRRQDVSLGEKTPWPHPPYFSCLCFFIKNFPVSLFVALFSLDVSFHSTPTRKKPRRPTLPYFSCLYFFVRGLLVFTIAALFLVMRQNHRLPSFHDCSPFPSLRTQNPCTPPALPHEFTSNTVFVPW